MADRAHGGPATVQGVGQPLAVDPLGVRALHHDLTGGIDAEFINEERVVLTDENPPYGIAGWTKDGRHLLVYNHTEKGRSPLNVAVSDDGATWRNVLTLEDSPGEYSYPAIIQSGDSNVHITYTHKRSRIKHLMLNPELLVAIGG